MAEFEFDLSELDSEADSAEARAPVRRPSSQSSFKPRPAAGAPNAVTQAQLEAALARVDSKIKTVADGVSTINARLASTASATKRELEKEKKSIDNTGKDLNSKLGISALFPALLPPKVKVPDVVIPPGTVFPGISTSATTAPVYLPFQNQQQGATLSSSGTIPAGGSIDVRAHPGLLELLLPFLLMTGSGSGSDGASGFDNNMMMLLILVLALGERPQGLF
jgi:hypothetical protein